MEHRIVLIDGYIDDPAALGVPPYISPMIRAAAGAAADAGMEVEYLTIDGIRGGAVIPKADVTAVLSGNTVPGKYIRSMPMSLRELESLVPKMSGWKMLGGSASSSAVADRFDFAVRTDLAAALYDGITGREVGERLRTLDEWNRWMNLGADIVRKHPDHPMPLIAEIETYRGCHRYGSGGCSYCIEPLKGKPLMRSPEDIASEASRLKESGVRNVRIGGQTCIISYGSEDDSGVPRPVPEKVRELFTALKTLEFDVLHVDNANAAVIAEYPEESFEVIRTLTDCCTPGNVLALGMESADPRVIRENNLNSTPSQIMSAVRMINRIGSERGDNGMPKLLPGINLISGLDGETPETNRMNVDFLRNVLDEGLMLRRINIRQVMPARRKFDVKTDRSGFRKYKETIRNDIDSEMLKRIAPAGTVLKNVYIEMHDGSVTFGRQIGTYPLLVGIPYRVDAEMTDVIITDHGFRSVTGIAYPFRINEEPMSSVTALPGIGRKRAASIVRNRPYRDMDELSGVVGDPGVSEKLSSLVSFDRIG